jgi:GNAT superfamily N-acetyltransferase
MRRDESQDCRIEQVTDFDSPLFELCLGVLEQSIEANEQLSRSRLRKLLSGGDYRLYALRDRNGIAGAASLYFSASTAFVLLDYLAIHPERRNQGLGSVFFRELTNAVRRENPEANWLILEVDDERENPDGKYVANRRRIEFYRRLGAQLLANVPYRFPSPSGVAVPMRLMVYRLQAGATLYPTDVRAMIEDSFRQVHGRRDEDELLVWFKAHMPDVLILE